MITIMMSDDDDDDDDMFICIYFIQSGMAQWLDDP